MEEPPAKPKLTRRERFLREMDQAVPRARLVVLIEPFSPQGKRGRPPLGSERMRRVYFLQPWYALADDPRRALARGGQTQPGQGDGARQTPGAVQALEKARVPVRAHVEPPFARGQKPLQAAPGPLPGPGQEPGAAPPAFCPGQAGAGRAQPATGSSRANHLPPPSRSLPFTPLSTRPALTSPKRAEPAKSSRSHPPQSYYCFNQRFPSAEEALPSNNL